MRAPRAQWGSPGGGYAHPDHIKCYEVSRDAFHAAADASAYPEAGAAWQVAKLYAIAQIDDGAWESLLPEFKAAGFDIGSRHQRRRGPGPETATVALDVRPYTEHQRRALLAHRTQVPRTPAAAGLETIRDPASAFWTNPAVLRLTGWIASPAARNNGKGSVTGRASCLRLIGTEWVRQWPLLDRHHSQDQHV